VAGVTRATSFYATSTIGVGLSTLSYRLQLSADSAAKPATNTWTIASDERIKKDISAANLDICYDSIKNIPLKRYTWRDDIYTIEDVADRSKLGWIAQDVEGVFPKAVSVHAAFGIDDCRDLNADQIYAAHYGATQKLMAVTESHESTIVGQSCEISTLKGKLETVLSKIGS
jgi:hypothetical protein